MQLDVELRLLALAREADVHGVRHLPHLRQHPLGRRIDRHRIRAAYLYLELLHAPRPVGREYGERGAGDPLGFRPQRRRELFGTDITVDFWQHLDVDVADIHGAGRAAAEGGVRVANLGMCPRETRRFLRLEPRVLEVRARRRLDLDVQLGVVVLGEEPDADDAGRRHGLHSDEGDDYRGRNA